MRVPPASRAAAAVLAACVAVLATGGTAYADPTPTGQPSPTPIISLPPVSPKPSPTHSPTPKPVLTHAPTPSPTHVRIHHTASPRPQPVVTTAAPEATLTATPVVPVVPTTSAPRTAPPKTKKTSSESGSSKLARLGWLVVGGALLLGIGGGAGLYLTRHQQ